jgi:biopolymer transport protein ExbB
MLRGLLLALALAFAGLAPCAAGSPAVPVAAPGVQAGVPVATGHDLSPLGMFMAADAVVKAVVVLLVIASLLTWTVWIAKSLGLAALRAHARRARDALEQATGLDAGIAEWRKAGLDKGTPAALAHAAGDELARGVHLPASGIEERIALALGRIEAAAVRRVSSGTGLLATVGATAPFVGLFGTVWGIMNAFIGIAQSKSTNLAVVAPGLAEALFVTGIGLVAAIPAVVFHNLISRGLAAFRAELADISALILRHTSRDLAREIVQGLDGELPLSASDVRLWLPAERDGSSAMRSADHGEARMPAGGAR